MIFEIVFYMFCVRQYAKLNYLFTACILVRRINKKS